MRPVHQQTKTARDKSSRVEGPFQINKLQYLAVPFHVDASLPVKAVWKGSNFSLNPKTHRQTAGPFAPERFVKFLSLSKNSLKIYFDFFQQFYHNFIPLFIVLRIVF